MNRPANRSVNKTKTILLVDDDLAHAKMLETLINDWGYKTQLADDGTIAVDMVKEKAYDMVVMDMKMVKMSGMEALKKIKAFNPVLPVIIMTAYSSVQTAVNALKIGAYDYLTKPLDFDKLKLTIERVFESIYLKSENKDLKSRLKAQVFAHDLIGDAPVMTALLDTIKMVAPTDASVLVSGESGTGKELVSAAIHYNSSRKDKVFVRINCAAITETLLESELFGHEKGSFTGADKARKGKFLLAHKGSILLDEIGEMSLSVQAKLLRVIQEKEITPVGSDTSVKTDVRIIAATNKDLKKRFEQGLFRQDLYYRLNVVNIQLPPLRERREDIPTLATHFLEEFSKKNRRDIKGFTPNAMDVVIRYNWEGNVRELKNCVERSVVLSQSDYISRRDLEFLAMDDTALQAMGIDVGNTSLSKIEQKAILETLAASKGNKSETARRLGITRKTLLKKLKQYGKS